MRRRITREMMVLAHRDKHQAAVNLPSGKIVDVLGPAEDDRFVRINVDGEEFEAFEIDLAERGHVVRSLRRAAGR